MSVPPSDTGLIKLKCIIHACAFTHAQIYTYTQALSLRMEKRPSVSDVNALQITKLNDTMVCAHPCIFSFKAVETQPHKS